MLIYSRSFVGELEDAEECLEQRRTIEPPVYNENRLKEKPIPEIPFEEMPDFSNISIEDRDETSSEISIDEEVDGTLAAGRDPLSNSLSGKPIAEPNLDSTNEAQQLNLAIEPANEIQQSNTVEINENAITEDDKGLVPLFNPVNDADVNDLLDDIEIDEYDEDVTMFIASAGLPKPMQSTATNLIKRENDSISGNIAFNVVVSIFLMKQFI